MDALQAKYERRVERERRARQQAEDLLEAKSRELYASNQELLLLMAELEERVCTRTRELDDAKQKAVRLAERDQLTGIANRMRFSHMLEAAIASAETSEQCFALFLIDLDDFKSVNDSLGHEAGDALLKEVAERLADATRQQDVVARIGGDEFAAIMVDCGAPGELTAIAQRMIASIRGPILYRDMHFWASCSIGIAIYPDHAVEAGELRRYADLALYRAKAIGRATCTVFDDALRRTYEERHALGLELETAIARGDVEAWFQPIVAARSGISTGVEALARWRHPTRGLLAPGSFLKVAEERNLMGDLFEAMLRQTCRATRPWLDEGLIGFASVNVSPSQFRSGRLAASILAILDELGFPKAALTIEITEELLLKDFAGASDQLDELARGGVRIALDDFGMGYSNIGYLRRLPIHKLKLDRMLTADIVGDAKARSVLGAIVDIARALDLDVIAEGVEDHEQAAWLAQLGCQSLQGFFFGRPGTAACIDPALRALHTQSSRAA